MKHQANKVAPERPNLKVILEKLAQHFGMPGVKEWVRHIEDPLDYDDPIERQGVVKKNIALIKSKLALFEKFSGMSGEQTRQFVDNEGNFPNEEWQHLQEIKDSLTDYEAAVEQVASDFEAKSFLVEEQAGGEEPQKPKRRMQSHKGWIPT